MTGVTLIAGVDVGGRLTRRHHAIMTALAGAHGFVVIDGGRRHPGSKGVTGGAHIARTNMGCILVGGNHAIMACFTHTDAGNFVVIHRTGRHPRRVDMTGFANIRGIDVRCRLPS